MLKKNQCMSDFYLMLNWKCVNAVRNAWSFHFIWLFNWLLKQMINYQHQIRDEMLNRMDAVFSLFQVLAAETAAYVGILKIPEIWSLCRFKSISFLCWSDSVWKVWQSNNHSHSSYIHNGCASPWAFSAIETLGTTDCFYCTAACWHISEIHHCELKNKKIEIWDIVFQP